MRFKLDESGVQETGCEYHRQTNYMDAPHCAQETREKAVMTDESKQSMGLSPRESNLCGLRFGILKHILVFVFRQRPNGFCKLWKNWEAQEFQIEDTQVNCPPAGS